MKGFLLAVTMTVAVFLPGCERVSTIYIPQNEKLVSVVPMAQNSFTFASYTTRTREKEDTTYDTYIYTQNYPAGFYVQVTFIEQNPLDGR